MGKRKVDDGFFDAGYNDIVITYPFCYKSKDNKNFFRYLEDGRYEFICMDKYNITMSFGSRAGKIDSLIEENDFYFKVLANLNEVISNEDFEFQRELYKKEYEKYLNGDKYLSREVEKFIEKTEKLKSNQIKKENNNNDIIVGEDAPF